MFLLVSCTILYGFVQDGKGRVGERMKIQNESRLLYIMCHNAIPFRTLPFFLSLAKSRKNYEGLTNH